MSEDFDREDDLQFFAQAYLLDPEYRDDELREMAVLHKNSGSCFSSTTRMRHGYSRERASKTSTEEKK